MRLLSTKFNDKNSEYFGDCFGNPLTLAQKSKLNLNHLQFFSKAFDSHENTLAYLFKEYDKIGAFSINGENYADFIYDRFEGITQRGYGSIGDDCRQEMWEGRRKNVNGDDVYDVYHRYELICEDVSTSSHLKQDSYFHYNRDFRYAILTTEDGYKVYDIFEGIFLNFTSDYGVSDIHSKYKRVFVSKSCSIGVRKYEYTYKLIDFDGNEIASYVSENWLRFTEKENFFLSHKDGKYGLVILLNGVLEEVIPCKYRKILQIFDNKAVVINSQNCVKVIHFEKKMKKGIEVWNNKLDSYKFPKEIVSAFFLEDESEAILELNSGMKILLSSFLKGNIAQCQCEDIFYEGNGIFKCFQFGDKDEASITFMYNGQAVIANSTDINGHLLNSDSNSLDNNLIAFTPDGKRIAISSENHKYYSDFGKKYMKSREQVDFMTIPKDEASNMKKFLGYSYRDESIVVNMLKGELFKDSHSEIMPWHNLFTSDTSSSWHHNFHFVRGEDIKEISDMGEFIAGFNEFMIGKIINNNTYYIFDRTFHPLEVKKARAKVDEIYQLCVVANDDEAYVVSNDGIEHFIYTGKACIMSNRTERIYKSVSSNNHVVGLQYVENNILQYEIAQGITDNRMAL